MIKLRVMKFGVRVNRRERCWGKDWSSASIVMTGLRDMTRCRSCRDNWPMITEIPKPVM